MGTYSEFADKMLVAIFQETERTGKRYHSFRELAERFGLDLNDFWCGRIADEWRNGFAKDIRTLDVGAARDWRASISAAGADEVEREGGARDRVGHLLYPVAVTVAAEPERAQRVDGEPRPDAEFRWEAYDEAAWEAAGRADPAAIDSAGWTGIARRLEASPAVVKRIRAKVGEIDALVEASHLSNEDRAKAKAISAALVSLVESPEPEWRAIVELLKSPVLGGIANLGTIVQWIVGAVVLAYSSMQAG